MADYKNRVIIVFNFYITHVYFLRIHNSKIITVTIENAFTISNRYYIPRQCTHIASNNITSHIMLQLLLLIVNVR